jgi:predicted RNase H-like nuclease (RuvC/YqgF family)
MSASTGTEIMSNELMIVLATASAAALVGGGLVAWLSTRNRPGADPEAEGRHELQLIELRETAVLSQQESRAAELQVLELRTELERARTHIGQLEDQVAAYLRQYAQAKNTLKAEIRQKGRLQMELAAATAQVESLQGRVQELEMERNAITGSLRRLSA